jgi:cysteine desulfurase
MFWEKRTYLDIAAGVSGNPSSPHEEGRRAKKMLEDARRDIARLVEVQSDDVIFTSGATESNALAILGHIRALRAAGMSRMHVMYLPSAHASIVENMKLLAEEGVEVEELPLRDARVDTEALAKMLRSETVLVSMDAVCGETGVVWNTRAVAEQLRESRGSGEGRIILHVDASQAPLTEKFTRAHFNADMLSFDASKVCEARGIGALIAHRTIPLMPLYRGGGQERGLRPGSEAPKLAREFAAALRAAAQGREAFCARAKRARVDIVDLIRPIEGVLINDGRTQVPNILNLSLPGRDTDYLIALLDEAGFAVSSRSACETDQEAKPAFGGSPDGTQSVPFRGSRAVFALTGSLERARATLRISWGPATRSRELACFAAALARAVAFIDSNSNG